MATKRQYEGMFLINQATAADLNGAVAHIQDIIAKAEGEIVAMKKWDERRLAYEIDKQKRGVYLLVYFNAVPQALERMTRDCNISEQIMRVMFLSAEHLTVEEMQAADARQELEVEARLRAEQAAREQEAGDASVSLGAPPRDEPQAAPQDAAEETAEDEAETARSDA
ncbi:MAG: 30S ribosomal protein S6 [Phycisphaerales bacterium]|nr:30S ribosomal protein S6 [Phycisphaerales bacterium]